jgi:hypothetical protein
MSEWMEQLTGSKWSKFDNSHWRLSSSVLDPKPSKRHPGHSTGQTATVAYMWHPGFVVHHFHSIDHSDGERGTTISWGKGFQVPTLNYSWSTFIHGA